MRTTPEAIDLQATFRAMLDAGDRACAMEVSSHALELRRADGVRFAVAAFTNLSQDHLDFHPDMETYFAAKERLFAEFDVGRAGRRGRRPVGPAARRTRTPTRSPSRSSTRRTGRPPRTAPGSAATRSRSARRPARRRSSCRCAAASTPPTRSWRSRPATRSGSRSTGWRRRCGPSPRCPGRVQAVDEGQGFAVLVDYAHKPGALEKVLLSAREVATGRVLAVFGAGGDRDRGKRPLMGEIAARLADHVIVTSDNPRSEPPDGDHRRDPRRRPGRSVSRGTPRRPPRRDRPRARPGRGRATSS